MCAEAGSTLAELTTDWEWGACTERFGFRGIPIYLAIPLAEMPSLKFLAPQILAAEPQTEDQDPLEVTSITVAVWESHSYLPLLPHCQEERHERPQRRKIIFKMSLNEEKQKLRPNSAGIWEHLSHRVRA